MILKRLRWLNFYWPGILRGLWHPHKLFQIILSPKSRVVLRKSAKINIQERFIFGYPARHGFARRFQHAGELCLGENAVLDIDGKVEFCPGNSLIIYDNARLSIGANTTFAGDSYFAVTTHSKIGKDCRFSWGVHFLDSDLHALRNKEGKIRNPPRPIILGDRVWICHRVSILKGVSIGDDSIVAAGAVVTKSFPARSIIAGIPAKKIGEFDGRWSLRKSFFDA